MNAAALSHLKYEKVNVVAHRLDPRKVLGNNERLLLASLQIRRVDRQRRLLRVDNSPRSHFQTVEDLVGSVQIPPQLLHRVVHLLDFRRKADEFVVVVKHALLQLCLRFMLPILRNPLRDSLSFGPSRGCIRGTDQLSVVRNSSAPIPPV